MLCRAVRIDNQQWMRGDDWDIVRKALKRRVQVNPSPVRRLAGYAGARAVITGGLGLIGSAIARRLVGLGAEVLLIDSMIPEYGGNLANISEIRDRVTVNIADIRGGYGLRHLLDGQDFLFNLAAQ